MGWADIKDRIEVPIMTDEGIEKIIDCYLDIPKIVHGKFEVSRVIMMDDYIKPAEKTFKTQEEFDEYVLSKMFEVMRYALKASKTTGKKIYYLNSDECEKIKNFTDADFYSILSLFYEREIEEKRMNKELKGRPEKEQIEKWKEIKNIYNKKIGEKYNLSKDAVYSLEKMFDNYNILRRGKYDIGQQTAFSSSNYSSMSKEEKDFTTRFYMNRNYYNKESWDFIIDFMKFCIDKDLTTAIKPTGADSSFIDSVILYANDKSRNKVIDFLQKYIKEHPEEMRLFGSPIATGGNVIEDDGRAYYAISRLDGKKRYLKYLNNWGVTYNYHFNIISEAAFASSCYKILEKYSPFQTKKFSSLSSPIDMDGGAVNLINLKVDVIQPIIPVIKKIIEENPTSKSELMKEYKDSLKRINSLYTYGDLNHLDSPICFDENLYNVNREVEIKEDLKYIKGYSDFIYKNYWSCYKVVESMPEEVRGVLKKTHKGLEEITKDDLKIIDKFKVKGELLKAVNTVIEKKGEPAKQELAEFVKNVTDSKKEKTDETEVTKTVYAQLRLIDTHFLYVTSDILKMPVEKREVLSKYKKVSDVSELGKEQMDELISTGVVYDLLSITNKIKSKVGELAQRELEEFKETKKGKGL